MDDLLKGGICLPIPSIYAIIPDRNAWQCEKICLDVCRNLLTDVTLIDGNIRRCLRGRTGHVIISTLHANSAVDAYNRILSMCVATGLRLSESKILEFILEAIPLVLFKRQIMPDGRQTQSVYMMNKDSCYKEGCTRDKRRQK